MLIIFVTMSTEIINIRLFIKYLYFSTVLKTKYINF